MQSIGWTCYDMDTLTRTIKTKGKKVKAHACEAKPISQKSVDTEGFCSTPEYILSFSSPFLMLTESLLSEISAHKIYSLVKIIKTRLFSPLSLFETAMNSFAIRYVWITTHTKHWTLKHLSNA